MIKCYLCRKDLKKGETIYECGGCENIYCSECIVKHRATRSMRRVIKYISFKDYEKKMVVKRLEK